MEDVQKCIRLVRVLHSSSKSSLYYRREIPGLRKRVRTIETIKLINAIIEQLARIEV